MSTSGTLNLHRSIRETGRGRPLVHWRLSWLIELLILPLLAAIIAWEALS